MKEKVSVPPGGLAPPLCWQSWLWYPSPEMWQAVGRWSPQPCVTKMSFLRLKGMRQHSKNREEKGYMKAHLTKV